MKIEDVKFNNFIRLCKEHGLDPNADQKGCGKKLAQLLNASKQHASQLLLGKSSIGYNTIDKLCKAWNINELEFIKINDINQNKFEDWPQLLIDACQDIKEILDSSDDETKDAILYNLKAFKKSVNKDKRIDTLENDITKIKKSIPGLLSDMGRKRPGAVKKTKK